MDGLTPEQKALFASIMGNSSQEQAKNPTIPVVETHEPEQPAPVAASDPNENRVLSQAEIDALIASMA